MGLRTFNDLCESAHRFTRSIIQRTGIVPMSIAGIFKEVTTILISTWVFGDQLTPINITGVVITICGKFTLCIPVRQPARSLPLLPSHTHPVILFLTGIALFTYHKYRKSIDSPVPLDAHGNPIAMDASESLEGEEESQPLTERHVYTDLDYEVSVDTVRSHVTCVTSSFFIRTLNKTFLPLEYSTMNIASMGCIRWMMEYIWLIAMKVIKGRGLS